MIQSSSYLCYSHCIEINIEYFDGKRMLFPRRYMFYGQCEMYIKLAKAIKVYKVYKIGNKVYISCSDVESYIGFKLE